MPVEITLHYEHAEPEREDKYFIVDVSWKTKSGQKCEASVGFIEKLFNKEDFLKKFQLNGNSSASVKIRETFTDRGEYEAYKEKHLK